MWFALPEQPVFAVAGIWQPTKDGNELAVNYKSCSREA